MGTRFYSVDLITDAVEETPSGGIRLPAHINRTGIQTYQTADGVSREYRPATEVFSQDTLDSFKGVAVTLNHPAGGAVDTRNWRSLAVGHIGDDVRQDGDLTLATVYLEDQAAIDTVRAGDFREVSAGYTTTVKPGDGETPEGERYDATQTQIRGNHVAIVKHGRGGPRVRLHLDSQGNQILEDGMTKEELRAELAVLKTDIAESQAKADERDAELETLRGNVDALKAENTDLQAKLDAAVSDDAMTARIDARLSLLDRCRVIKADVRTDGSDREIILDALGERATADASDEYLRGALDTHVELAQAKVKNDTTVNEIVNPNPAPAVPVRNVLDEAEDAYWAAMDGDAPKGEER